MRMRFGDLTRYYLGTNLWDVQQYYWSAHLKHAGTALLRSKQTMQLYLTGQVSFDDPMVIVALGTLVDLEREQREWNR